MLHFLTDEQISPAVANTARRVCPDIQIADIRDWQRGHMLPATDESVLREAHQHGLTLVTFDLRTIPPLLRTWAEQGVDHSGVILVDDKTIPQVDVDGLAEALGALWISDRELDWEGRVVFLRRARA